MTDGKIFISYRRADSAYAAGRLYDRLSARFGEEHVFMDVEHLDPGVNFVKAINDAVSECDVLIALIGPRWLSARDENGNRRLDNPLDFVRLEIAAALKREIRVVPILLEGAAPPKQNQLPNNLQPLAQLNAFEIRDERFPGDADRLARSIIRYREEDAQRREQEATEQIADHLQKARLAEEREDWETAQRHYRHMLELRSTHTEAQTGLLRATQNYELASLYGDAILYQSRGHYQRALRNLRQIQAKAPGYRNVAGLIAALEARLAEPKPEKKPEPAHRPKRNTGNVLKNIPMRVVWSGLGLVAGIALLCWGGNTVLEIIKQQTPEPTTTMVIVAATHTDTPQPATATAEILPTSTTSPVLPTNTPVVPTPTPDFGAPMVLIPAGAFEMGSTDGASDEQPVHSVTLDAYYIDQYEVTNAEYADFLNAQGNQSEVEVAWLDAGDSDVLITQSGGTWQAKSSYEDHPVVEVSWYGARAYCDWRGVRLPTEAEWEKAARGEDGSVYPWGDEFDCSKGNFDDETILDDYVVPGGAGCDGYNRTAPVGSFTGGASRYGVMDMAGNVWEWVSSLDKDYPYDAADGREDLEASGNRVLRGGSWDNNNSFARSAYRLDNAPSSTPYGRGFRCARSP